MNYETTFEPYSGNLLEGLIDLVDGILLPHRDCDGHDFHMGESFRCPMPPVRNIGGQDFCAKHANQAWESQTDLETRLR